MTQVDLLIKNAQVFNVFLKKFIHSDVTIKDKFIGLAIIS